MAGNSKRKGAIKKTGKGNPTAGSGGRVRRGLEGRGPTPKATDRPYHQAHKAAKRAEKTKDTRAKRRTTSDAEWAAGRNSVVELLRGGVPVTAIYVAEGAERDNRLREAFKLAAEQGVKLLEVTRNEMDRMTSGAIHQGLAARLPAYQYAHADDLLDRADEAKEPALIVALDSITDPRNLGAVVRSAAGFGAHGVLIPERRAAGMTASAWKTSAGAAARLPIAQTVNLTRQIKAYQEAGCMVVGLAADGDISLPSSSRPAGSPRDRWSSSSGRRAPASVAWSPRPATRSSRSRWPGSWSPSTPVWPPRSPSTRSRRPPPLMSRPRRLLLGIALVSLSVALGLSVAAFLFLTSSRTVVVVGHDTVVRPTIARDAVIQTGPILPDFRIRDVGPVGVTLSLGKTQVGSIEELVDRYALIAGDPAAQIAKVQGVVLDMAVAAAVRGLAVGLLPVVVFLLLGTAPARRALPRPRNPAGTARRWSCCWCCPP